MSRVVRDELDNGFAVIRPPGHHAEPGLACGYCLINNVAVAASYARRNLGVAKILIVDWDVHHGNGTQSIFINDPNVMYFSVHRWQRGKFFPFQSNGGPECVGEGPGKGFNVNVGWSRKGMGDDEYRAVWDWLLMPMAKEFEPDLILVSAGFDAAEGDMGECLVTPECFHHLTRKLLTLSSGKLVAALEGGYVRSVLANCVSEVALAMLQPEGLESETTNSFSTIRLENIDSAAADDIRATASAHADYWNCLKQWRSKVNDVDNR